VSDAAIARAAVGTTLTTLFGGALTFATAALVSRALGASAKGAYDLMVASAWLAFLVVGFALPTGVTFVTARQPETARQIPATALLFSSAIAIVVATALFVLFDAAVVVGVLPEGRRLESVTLVGVLAGATAYLAFTRAALIAVLRIGVANLSEAIGRLMAFLVSIALVAVGLASSASMVLALIVGTLLGAGMQTATLRPSGFLHRSTVRDMATFARPGYVAILMQYMNYRLDIFLVAAFRSVAEVGLYAVAVVIGQLVWLLSRGAATALFPVIAADQDLERVRLRLGRASRLAFLTGIVGAAGIAVVGPPTIGLLFGSEFVPAVPALWLLLPGIVAFCPVTIAGAYFLGANRQRSNIAASGVSLAVTLVADVVLIPRFGIEGAAAASSLSYVTALLVSVILLNRWTGTSPAELLVPRPRELVALVTGVMRKARNPLATEGADG
jgi:O-antigen/teichoic acid export membrane protein